MTPLDRMRQLRRGARPASEADAFLLSIIEERRRPGRAARKFATAIERGDFDTLSEAISEVEASGAWTQAFRRCAAIKEPVSSEVQAWFLRVWISSGDAMRDDCNDDLALVRAARVLLPAYEGPGVTLYRGQGAMRPRSRQYGMSWSASQKVADHFAKFAAKMSRHGGVLLRANVPPAAIICSPAMLGEEHAAEQEYVVDRRLLRGVRAIRRYPVETLTIEGADAVPAGSRSDGRL